MKILKRLLGNDPAPPKLEAPSQADGQEHSRATELGSQTTTRRELLRVLTRDTARYCGIPEGWIECHVLVVSTRKGDTHLHARLVLRYWDDTLVRHVMAFEMRLRAEILRFEPQASDWLHSVTWEFKAENCPHLEMPPRDTWGKAAAPASVMLLDSEGGPGSDDEDGQARVPLLVRRHDVKTIIDRDLAITDVEQVFFNPRSEELRGIYTLRLPRGAMVAGFEVRDENESSFLWNTEIGRYIQRAVPPQTNGQSLAGIALEWAGPDRYRAAVGNLQAGKTKIVHVRYTEWLSRHDGRRTFVYPMGGGQAPLLGEFSLEVDTRNANAGALEAGMGARIEGGKVVLRKSDFRPHADFALDLLDAKEPAKVVPAFRVSATDGVGRGYLVIPLALPLPPPPAAVDLVLLVDASAATDPGRLDLARAVVDAILRQLQKAMGLIEKQQFKALVISNDGWEHAKTDILTLHDYEGKREVLTPRYATKEAILASQPAQRVLDLPGFPYEDQPIMVTEFGGIGYKKDAQEGWGYTTASSDDDYVERYRAVVESIYNSDTISGFCYTQITDVEQEINGLLTYDRQPKVPLEVIKQINDQKPTQ